MREADARAAREVPLSWFGGGGGGGAGGSVTVADVLEAPGVVDWLTQQLQITAVIASVPALAAFAGDTAPGGGALGDCLGDTGVPLDGWVKCVEAAAAADYGPPELGQFAQGIALVR